jgi:hypothetical protein
MHLTNDPAARAHLLIFLFIFSFSLNLSAQVQKPETIYLVDGERVTEEYINGLDVNRIKSMDKGLTDILKEDISEKYGKDFLKNFFMVITLYTEEEMKTWDSIVKGEEPEVINEPEAFLVHIGEYRNFRIATKQMCKENGKL